MPADPQSPAPRRISRRTVAAGAAWAVPAVAVTAASPAYAASGITTTTTTLPPCIQNVGATGDTYPVTYALSGCETANSHWDFQFLINAALASGTDCSDCKYLQITLFDNPKRSRLWIIGTAAQNTTMGGDPNTNTNNYNRLYVQKVLAAGASGTFPKAGDVVRRVSGPSPYTSFNTAAGDEVVGPIETYGQSNDTMHVLMTPGGGLPCSASGPMAYYKVECSAAKNGPWSPLGGIGQINPCIPMIKATVCRPAGQGTGPYRIKISVLNPCDVSANSFRITNIQRNDDTNYPTQGTSVFSNNPGQVVGGGAGTSITIAANSGSGGQFWISFTTDGVNVSQIRVPTSDAAC